MRLRLLEDHDGNFREASGAAGHITRSARPPRQSRPADLLQTSAASAAAPHKLGQRRQLPTAARAGASRQIAPSRSRHGRSRSRDGGGPSEAAAAASSSTPAGSRPPAARAGPPRLRGGTERPQVAWSKAAWRRREQGERRQQQRRRQGEAQRPLVEKVQRPRGKVGPPLKGRGQRRRRRGRRRRLVVAWVQV